MSETRYEGYKDALRRGHLAALRGRLSAAATAYREASRIAPDRSLPFVGLAGVLARSGRADEALAAYAAALGRAPNDEGALRGRADIEAEIGRWADAASTLDRLTAVLESQGRLADACDAARRALELAESRGRRRGVATLVERLRELTGDPSAAQALERALSVLEVDPTAVPQRVAGSDLATPRIPTPDPGLLTQAVEVAIDAGDLDEARRQAVLAADGHRAVGRLHAAIDACYEVLAVAPADPDIHLALAGLYLDRGWRTLAADKLVLLGRLVQLTGDGVTRARLCELAAARFADDPRLTAICG